MATRIGAKAGRLYETDFYAWTQRQAALLRAGRLDELDLEHLVEEIDDLGESLYRSARSRIQTIIEHLLKLQYSPAREPRRGWHDTILAQRRDLEDNLRASLRPRIEADLETFYARARQDTERSLRRYGEDAAADVLPATCPYSFEQITGDWLP
jgi:hypothetical protein